MLLLSKARVFPPKTGEKNGMLLAILGAVSLFFTVLIMSILKKRND